MLDSFEGKWNMAVRHRQMQTEKRLGVARHGRREMKAKCQLP